MTIATSSTQDRRGPAPGSLARPPTSSRVVISPTIVSQLGTVLRTSSVTPRVAAQAPDPRSHAGQRRNNADGASASVVVAASLTGAEAARAPGRLIGIIRTTVLLVALDPERGDDDRSEREESWLAS